MLSGFFHGFSLLGAEWVLYLLVIISIISVGLIIERIQFYKKAELGLSDFRATIRAQIAAAKYPEALTLAQNRLNQSKQMPRDLETELAVALLTVKSNTKVDVLEQVAHDVVTRIKLDWDKNLSVLATVGNNAPFVGLFGTVLGIIKAFNDLSQQSAQGVQMVTAGVSEALVATAIGILVAIPAVVAFNFFQRRVRSALSQAEAFKSFLIGRLCQ